MAACQRPGCSSAPAATMLLHRNERRAELVPLGDAVGDRYGIGLCETHLLRAKPPKGWTLVDRREAPPVTARPRVHGAPGSSTNPPTQSWSPTRGRQVPEVLSSARSPLLRRAFLGLDEGLAGLERMDDQVDADPQGLGDGVEEHGDDNRDTDGGSRKRDESHVGPHQHDAGSERDGDHGEGDDGVHANGADEVAGLALEDVATTGAAVAKPKELLGQPALATNRTPSGEAADDQPSVAGGSCHEEEPTAGQLRLAV